MGEELFSQFSDYVRAADEILGYSIEELCVKDPENQLSNTVYTQPALYVVNALSYLKKIEQDPAAPGYLAGHSLGEYSALFAAGAFSFDVGLRLVKKRAELMGQASGGGMAAVLGCTGEKVVEVIGKHGFDEIDVANYNSQTQTVISGALDQLDKAQSAFEAEGAMFYPLPVSAAFHSRYMRSAVDEYEAYLNEFTFNALNIPVIANISAEPYEESQIVFNLKEQLCGSVRWVDTIQYVMSKGSFDYEEIGPGDVLTKLVKSIVGS